MQSARIHGLPAMTARDRTLCDIRPAGVRGVRSTVRLLQPSLCSYPTCRCSADYLIPVGTTPRTQIGALWFCVECLEGYLTRLKSSMVLTGEVCEWELTIRSLVNAFDGVPDHLALLGLEDCEHKHCSRRAQASIGGVA
jgi:hypothetical protein